MTRQESPPVNTHLKDQWYLFFTWAVGCGSTFFSHPSVRQKLSIGTGAVPVLLGVATGV